jgi:hypothetical protein
MCPCMQPDTSPQRFVSDLRKFIAGVEVWWDNRNSRRPAGDSGNLQTGKCAHRCQASVMYEALCVAVSSQAAEVAMHAARVRTPRAQHCKHDVRPTTC